MTPVPHGGRDVAQVAIGATLVAIAGFVLWQAASIPADGGYSVVGPRFTPLVIGAGLAIIGALLLLQAFAGGWKGMEAQSSTPRMHAPAFAWIAGGLVLHMIVIGVVGFTLASTLLFTMVARGFGSRRIVRDAVIGLVLATIVFLFFTRVLNLSLPASPLGAI